MRAIKATGFGEVLAEVERKQAESERYVKETGKCFACKTHPVIPGQLRCEACVKRTEEILRQLRGPGFSEIRVTRRTRKG